MRQVTVETVISAPREAIFDFVSDLSLRPAYSDHYLEDYRLARANPRGLGAAARFKVKSGPFSEWMEIAITECDRPRRIVEEGRVGRLGRSRMVAVYEFSPEAGGTTRVELTTYGEPKTALDKFKQARAARSIRRKSNVALRRLKRIFEDPPTAELKRVTLAGHEPLRAPRFGDHISARQGPAASER